MKEVSMNISSPNLIDFNLQTNGTFPLLQFHHTWIFSLFILSLIGIFFMIIIFCCLLYFSLRRLNDHFILPNLFICFSVCFIYIIILFLLIRGNELFCGLREFLSQFAYALLFSALLCRYIMQWLSTRILSKRTKQFTSILIYFLLISTQIPIGILWWYFTIPRLCPHRTINESRKFQFHFHQRIFTRKLCSYQCIVDYRFYATYTYIILELVLCTIISIGLFFYRCYHRNRDEKDRYLKTNNNHRTLAAFLNMLALIFINIAWLIWTIIYHFTHSFFAFPALVIGMFTIGTISLVFILCPQIYFYFQTHLNDLKIPKTTLFSNKLASTEDIKDQDSLLQENQTEEFNQNKQQIISNGSEVSYELGTSGTFLPITRTPKGLYKVTNTEKIIPTKKLDQFIYGEHSNTAQISNHQNQSTKNECKINTPFTDVIKQQSQSPLQRQLTLSSVTSNFTNPAFRIERLRRSNSNIDPSSTSMYYSSQVPPYQDETFIPILCTSQNQISAPVKMRILVKSPSSSVPTTRRIYSGADHRYVQQHPYQHFPTPPPPPPPPPATPLYYSPSMQQQQYQFFDPYRPMPSYSGGNLWQSGLPTSRRYPYPYRRFHVDYRSLSQRLWDIDSGDDQEEMEENLRHTQDHITPTKERLEDFRSSHLENDDHTLLNIDDDGEENSSNKKIIFV